MLTESFGIVLEIFRLMLSSPRGGSFNVKMVVVSYCQLQRSNVKERLLFFVLIRILIWTRI
jgi:hypothetical protein